MLVGTWDNGWDSFVDCNIWDISGYNEFYSSVINIKNIWMSSFEIR